MKMCYLSVLAGFFLAITATIAGASTSFIANSFYSAGSPLSKYAYIEWSKTVKKMSDGNLEPDPTIGTVLMEPRASLQGVQNNIAQVATMPAMYTPSAMPVANTTQQLGFVFTDSLVAILAVTDFATHNPAQLQEWQDLGIVYLGGYATPSYVLMCSQPVRNLKEIKGMRIRSAGSAVSQWIESVGAIPVNIPSSEMYMGLDRGTLDCAANAANDLKDRSLWEVAKYVTMLPTGIYYAGPHWGYNADFWASLSSKQRHTLMKATAYSMARMTINYLKNVDEAIKFSKKKGVHFYQPAGKLKQTVVKFREKVLSQAYKKGKTKFGLKNPKKVIDSFRAKYKKWQNLLRGVDRNDPEALADLAMKEIYSDLDPKTYGVY